MGDFKIIFVIGPWSLLFHTLNKNNINKKYFILQKGDPLPSRLEYQIPVGWVWEDEWDMDLGRAVDEEGRTCFVKLNKMYNVVFYLKIVLKNKSSNSYGQQCN